MARSEEEPEGLNAAFQAPTEQYSETGGEQQPAPVRRGRTSGTSPQQGRAELSGQPDLGQHFPRLPGVGTAAGRFRVKPAREAQPRRAPA